MVNMVAVCGCWLTQLMHAAKTRPGAPETSDMKAELGRCQMATKPRNRYCADCQSGISCYQHMGICKKNAFIACDLCLQYKCYQERCIDKICCAESYARMNSERKTCGKEVLAKKSKMPPLTSSLASSPRPRSVPAAPGSGPAIFTDDIKTDDGLPKIQ